MGDHSVGISARYWKYGQGDLISLLIDSIDRVLALYIFKINTTASTRQTGY